jgi:hypothetical protein
VFEPSRQQAIIEASRSLHEAPRVDPLIDLIRIGQ